jgi:CheY-like chemotaxis protein
MTTNIQFNSVLIIDDNKIDAILNKKIIEKDEYSKTVIIYNSAIKALEYLESLINNNNEQIPSLIFVDMMMPEMNGFQFIEKFEALPEAIQAQTKIIFMSGSLLSDEQTEKLSKSKSVIKFISKPINKASLGLVKELYFA